MKMMASQKTPIKIIYSSKNIICMRREATKKKRQEERRWVKRVIWKIAIAGANCWIIFSNYETSNRKLKRRRFCPTEMRNNGNAWCCHRLCNNANYYHVNNIFIYAHLHKYIHTHKYYFTCIYIIINTIFIVDIYIE